MKKSLLLVAMLSMLATSFAQEDNIFNIRYNWDKMLAYTYQPGYPYGFGLSGGTFMSFGFSDGETRYRETTTDYYQPTWSLRFGWIGYTFDWGAISIRPFVNMGMDFMKYYTNSVSGWDSDTKTYFTFAPSLGMNVYMFNFFVGYEIVPHFKQLNGINFGAGFSIPLKTSTPDELQGKISHK